MGGSQTDSVVLICTFKPLTNKEQFFETFNQSWLNRNRSNGWLYNKIKVQEVGSPLMNIFKRYFTLIRPEANLIRVLQS